MSYNPENEMYEGYIYKITNTINNKVYIGQTTKTVEKRWQGHRLQAKNDKEIPYFHKAINKYGVENFNVETLEKLSDYSIDNLRSRLNDMEIKYISMYDSCNENNGYNLTKGGNNNYEYVQIKTFVYTCWGEFIGEFPSRTEAGKAARISGIDVVKSIYRNGIRNGYYFSNTKEFNFNPKKKHIPVDVYDIKGNYILSAVNYSAAAKRLGINLTSASSVLTGKTKSINGYIFKYYYEKFDGYKNEKYRPICIYKNSNYIGYFDSISAGARYINCSTTQLGSVLSGKQKTCGDGYNIYYAEDPNQPDKTKIVA